MPRSTREWAQRKLDQAHNNIDWTGKHISDVIDKYQEVHPEIADPLTAGLNLLAEVQILFDKVRQLI